MDMNWVNKSISEMTLEEKVGQVIMLCFFNFGDKDISFNIDIVKRFHIGGVFHFNAPVDILAENLAKLQSVGRIPLLVGSDYEAGVGHTVSEGMRFPRPMARGYAGNADSEYEIGRITATQGRALGTHITFNPVVDLNTNNLCPDVNNRAYGEDVETVCKLAIPLIKGIQENGMLAAVKHFPGNGGTDMDQHICTAVIPLTREEFEKENLEPYRRAFKEADVAAVMIAHLEVPAFTTEINPKTGRLMPASLSSEVVTDLLRDELGFKGLAITDAMNMGGVTTQFTEGEAVVQALKAGIDLLLIFNPWGIENIYDSILASVKSGELPLKRLDDAVKNVLIAKSRAGLDLDGGIPSVKEVRNGLFNSLENENFCMDIAEKAVTLLRNKEDLLPLGSIKDKKISVLNTVNPDAQTMIKQGEEPIDIIISDLLEQRGALVTTYELSPELSTDEIMDIMEKIQEADYIFFNFFIVPSWGIGSLIPNKSALRMFMFGLLSMGKKVIITSFGDPYTMYYFPAAPVYMCLYDEGHYSQKAAVRAWLGEAPVNGKIPVSLKGIFRKGDGLQIGAVK